MSAVDPRQGDCVLSLAADFEIGLRIVLHAAASAAVGTTRRRAAQELKHIVVQEFGHQGVVQGG